MIPFKLARQCRNQEPTILIAAALNVELTPLKKHTTTDCLFLETGMGRANASGNLRSFLRYQPVHTVISMGLAGALSSNLQVGDLVIVKQFLDQVEAKPCPSLIALAEEIKGTNPNVYCGSCITVKEIICNAKQRQHLAENHTIHDTAILDMESSAIAEACAEFEIPFIIIRSISDRFDEDLPIDFNKCIGDDGNLKMAKILQTILLNPLVIKELLVLKKRCQLCTRNLVYFVNQLLPKLIEAFQKCKPKTM